MEPIVGKRRIFMSIRIWCFSWVCWNKAWSRPQDRSPIAIKTFTTQKSGKLKTWPNWKQFWTLFGEIDGLSYMLIFGNNYDELARLQTSHGIKKSFYWSLDRRFWRTLWVMDLIFLMDLPHIIKIVSLTKMHHKQTNEKKVVGFQSYFTTRKNFC